FPPGTLRSTPPPSASVRRSRRTSDPARRRSSAIVRAGPSRCSSKSRRGTSLDFGGPAGEAGPDVRIVVLGAPRTTRSAVVSEVEKRGHDVIRVSHSRGDRRVDVASESSIAAMYAALGPFDALVSAAGNARFAPLEKLSTDDFRFSLDSKLMGQVNLVRQ